ncbi:hypothetical protein ACFY00_32750 [Kitasatospora sp. NPDC001540]|uniref:hypothetical protein n=1 Tax=Kitasatospora sp. NPDC001540 TaxID=3364014 RepID=UPI0036B8AFCA
MRGRGDGEQREARGGDRGGRALRSDPVDALGPKTRQTSKARQTPRARGPEGPAGA